MDDGVIEARGVHLLQQIVFGEARDLPVVRIGGLGAAPDVDLCVDDAHGVLPRSCSRRSSNNPGRERGSTPCASSTHKSTSGAAPSPPIRTTGRSRASPKTIC